MFSSCANSPAFKLRRPRSSSSAVGGVSRARRSSSESAASTSAGVCPACTVAEISMSPPSTMPLSQAAETSWAIFFW